MKDKVAKLKDPSEESLAYRLRWARKLCGYTQKELGEKTGLLISAISHFENGRREPCLKNFFLLCRAMRPISADVILGLRKMQDSHTKEV